MRQALSALYLLTRVLIGLVLVVSSGPKLQQPYDFLSIIYGYELVGPRLGLVAAMLLPWFELVAGFCLVAGILETAALIMSSMLFALFTLAMASALHRGLAIACGCFDVRGETLVTQTTVVRTGILFAANCIALLFRYRSDTGFGDLLRHHASPPMHRPCSTDFEPL